MPYSQKFTHVLYARASGKRLNDPKLDKITPEEAKAMLTEAKSKALSK